MNELYHHGIKGMKWGVRRYQNKDGTLTAAGKKRYSDDTDSNDTNESGKKKLTTKQKVAIGAVAAASVLAIAGGVYLYKKKSYLNSVDINSIKRGKYVVDEMSKDTIIPKGHTIFRTSNNNTLRNELTYVSLTRDDKNRYITRMGRMYSREKLYQMNIKTLTDIKIPSEKKQFDMFVDLLTNDADFSAKVTYNPYGESHNVFGNRKLAEKFASNYHYDNFITRTIDLGTNYDKDGTLSRFANYVKSNGYSGLIDTNDIGTTSEKPIMIFDTNDNLLVESAKKLNAGMKFVAGLSLKNVRT